MMMGPAWMTIDEKVLLAHCCLHTLDESNHNQDKSNRALQEMTSSMRHTLMTNHAQAEQQGFAQRRAWKAPLREAT